MTPRYQSFSTDTQRFARIARWRERLIRLPESVFLDLVRNYLGEIRTPFNKQDLLQRLEAFFSRTEVKERIRILLSLEDRQILSAVKLVHGSTEERLHELTGSGRSYLDFHIHILNLEDRLLIWRDGEEGAIRLNPHVEEDIAELLSDDLVIGSADETGDELSWPSGSPEVSPRTGPDNGDLLGMHPWLDDRAVAALVAFAREEPEVFKVTDQVRKRASQEFETRFGGIRDILHYETEPAMALRLCVSSLRFLGLTRVNDDNLEIDYTRLREFAELGAEERILLVWAAALYPRQAELIDASGQVAYFSQAKLLSFARVLSSWASRLDPDKAYTAPALKTFWAIEADKAKQGKEPDEAGMNRMLIAAECLGLFRKTHSGWMRTDWSFVLPDPVKHGLFRADASLEVHIGGHPALTDLIPIALCAYLVKHGLTSQYRITQQSARGAFFSGYDPQSLCDEIERQSGKEVPQSLAFSLGEWHKDFLSIRIVDGIVVIAEGRRKIELQHAPSIKPHIVAVPADGVFVFDRFAARDWLPILESMGIPVESRTVSTSDKQEAGPFLPPFKGLDFSGMVFPPAPSEKGPVSEEIPREGKMPEHTAKTATIPQSIPEIGQDAIPSPEPNKHLLLEDLRSTLDDMHFGEDLQQELAHRIRTGLILIKEQLVPGAVRFERSEARGLDYSGKLRVVEQVIKSKRDFIDVQVHNDGGDRGQNWRILVWPQKLRPMGSEVMLIAQTVPEGKELSIAMRRILSVKRVRGSIFG